MKKFEGYYIAAGALLFTLAVTALAKRYGQLLDAFYPYVTRQGQKILAGISGIFSFSLWQVIAILLALILVGTLALVIWKKKSIIRWTGWVLAAVSLGYLLHTGIYGLNAYTSPLSQDLRLERRVPGQEDYDKARLHFRDRANALAAQLPRDENGEVVFDGFGILAAKAANGFQNLTKEGYAVFAGSVQPTKKLLWPGLFSNLGMEGMTVALTGEACVNPDLPPQAQPFVMCRQMARRMCIVRGRDADFAAFLACQANEDIQFQYAAYHMACLALDSDEALAALLVNWHLQKTAQESQEQTKFDPTDKDYISGILGEQYG